jgi:SulP family sulfate permease
VYATALASVCLAGLAVWQFLIPKIFNRNPWTARLTVMPGSVVALVTATLSVMLFDLPVETIGMRFGGIPAGLPSFAWPDFDWSTAQRMFIPALTLAMLGAIESLLCARVADGLIDDRHNPNQELMAQGIANFVTPFFGGMPATGTIARTVTNVKSGATSPIAGIVHGLVLLVIVLVAAPMAKNIPLCAMAAILMYVAWNMGEWREFAHLWRFRIPYRFILLSVFVLTVIVDLTVAVEVGLVAAFVTFVYRISSLSRCEAVPLADHPCVAKQLAVPGALAAYRVYGALFFGAVTLIENLHDNLPSQTLLLDLKNVIYIDASGGDTLNDLVHACQKNGVALVICGLNHQPLEMATRCGFSAAVGAESLLPDLATALAFIGAERP